MSQLDNKRVAKNTAVLYGRMLITMMLGVLTSRIVLNALGFTDQGLYNVVGGFVGFLSLVTGSLSAAISRYITFEIGRANIARIEEVCQNAYSVQIILSLIIVILAETLGLWLLTAQLVIPEDRVSAVQVVYQMSILTFVINLMSVSQNAMIIAHERMSIYAYVSIFNAIGSFVIALLIANTSLDRLVEYAILQCVLAFLVRLFYSTYIRRNFSYCKFRFLISKEFFGPIFKFAGWNFIGSASQILRVSGTSVLLNIFGGPIANTINGLANSVNNLATLFVNDFTTAYNPQITKKYATEQYENLISFICSCSKYSFFLLSIIAIPVIINVESVLILWFKNIPPETPVFARLIIVYSLIECLSKPLITAKIATGQIRNYQLIVGGITLLTIPLSYLFLKLGLALWMTYIAMIITAISAFIARMLMLNGDIPGWNSWIYIKKIVLNCIFVFAVSIIPLYLVYKVTKPIGWWSLISCAFGTIWCIIICYSLGCTTSEKKVVKGLTKNLYNRIANNGRD